MNFRRRRPREATDARRNDWRSWRSDGVLKRIWRQSHGLPKLRKGDKGYREEQELWDQYLRENFGEKEKG